MTSAVSILEDDTSSEMFEVPSYSRLNQSHFENALLDPWYKGINALMSNVYVATNQFFGQKEMRPALLPITTGSISSPMGLGSDSKPVEIWLGGKPTYLADSMQFLLEYALRHEKNGVYYIMPSFRDEEQDSRHLNQFYHSEAEIRGDLEDVIRLADDYLLYLCQYFLNNCADTLLRFTPDLDHLQRVIAYDGRVPRIRFEEAVKLLGDNPEFIEQHEAGFQNITNAGELELLRRHGEALWVTHFPKLSVPFYQADEPGTEYSMTADLLIGIGETIGSGERNTTADLVLKNLMERDVSPTEYEWYVKMRQISPLKTSGFGMGMERLILWLIDHDDIRHCQQLPRVHGYNILP